MDTAVEKPDTAVPARDALPQPGKVASSLWFLLLALATGRGLHWPGHATPAAAGDALRGALRPVILEHGPVIVPSMYGDDSSSPWPSHDGAAAGHGAPVGADRPADRQPGRHLRQQLLAARWSLARRRRCRRLSRSAQREPQSLLGSILIVFTVIPPGAVVQHRPPSPSAGHQRSLRDRQTPSLCGRGDRSCRHGHARLVWYVALPFIAAHARRSQLGRMSYEERLLREVFPGYDAYARRTARLIPAIW